MQTEDGKQTFPGSARREAGISGWAIKARAQEVSRVLVQLREKVAKQTGKQLTIMGLGGILSAADFWEYLKIGVDAAESCTGAFLNPHLGLELRLDSKALENKRNALTFEFEVMKNFFSEVFQYPTKPSRLMVDRKNKRVAIYKGL